VRPDLNSWRGLAIACGMNPRYGDLDPYWMAASAIDEAVRNCVSVGADPSRIAILDNFCWGNTERPETLGSLVRASLACRDIAIAYGTPFVSGKDSLNNEFTSIDDSGKKQTVAIPASLLITALGQLPDIRKAVTMDLKESGNLLFLIGDTRDELGGSHYALVNGLAGGNVPRVVPEGATRIFRAVYEAIQAGCVRSCHDLSEGGLATALAEMAFAGGLGVNVTLKSLATQTGLTSDAALLFSESNTRFVMEVPATSRTQFVKLLANIPCVELGTVASKDRVQINGAEGGLVVDSALSDLKAVWQRPLAWD
jgi:phosphoribosylformylglycinamidine synthase